MAVLNGTMLASRLSRPLDRKRLANVCSSGGREARKGAGAAERPRHVWGATGFERAMIAERDPNAPTRSWRMLFDPEAVAGFADCGVYLPNEPRTSFRQC